MAVAGTFSAVVAVVTGDTEWTPAAIAMGAFVVSYVVVAASGGGPRRRLLDGVSRFLPAPAVRERPVLAPGLRRGLPLLFILGVWAVAGSPLSGAAFGLGFGLTAAHDLRLVRRWEREHGARLAYEHWSWSYRLSHLLNLPEHVGVRH